MGKKLRRGNAFACVGLAACLLVSCAPSVLTGGDIPTIKKTSTELTYHASDESLAAFMKDFYSRHVRNGDDAIGSVQLGKGETYQKLWETTSVVWFDSTIEGLKTYDALENIRTYLSNLDVDSFGNTYSSPCVAQGSYSTTNLMGQGWPFPTYNRPSKADGNYLNLYGVEFNNVNENWTVNGESAKIDGGFLYCSYSGSKNRELTLQSPTFSADGTFANFIEVDFRVEDTAETSGYTGGTLDDFYLCWRTEEGGDEWFEVGQKEFAANPQEMSGYGFFRTYFPMYLHEEWDKKTITDVKVVFKPKDGEKLNCNVKLNYFRMMTDTRNSVNGPNFISSLEKYVAFTGDVEFLKENMTRARRAMLFQLEALDGKNGLIDLSYLRGHSTSAVTGSIAQNGFWDTLVTGNKNLEANYMFYGALRSLANLERMLADSGERVDETAKVRNPYVATGGQEIVYTETADSLDALAEEVKANVRKPVTEGGFWNEETGRFAWAIRDENSKYGEDGSALDYGYTELNLRMVDLGLATDEQARLIFSWLDGERTVAGDKSTGDDIYFYEFGPRVSTKQNANEYSLIWGTKNIRWAVQCQNGGGLLFISYYDLMARTKALGADNSYQRLKGMQSWYEDVQSYGGTGIGFYDQYYLDKMIDPEIGGDWFTLQGGTRGNGAVGLDAEFYESALVYSAIPHMYFGLNSSRYKTLEIAPNLPTDLKWFALENLMFSKIPYDCYITNDTVVISGVRGETDGERVQISLKEPTKTNYKVQINGKDTSDYEVKDGRVVVNVPLSHVKVSVK